MDEQTLTAHYQELEIAAAKIQVATEDRDEAITAALVAGVPVGKVAQAVGLTRQRVWQIGRATGDIRLM
jgi:hypothetical protein